MPTSRHSHDHAKGLLITAIGGMTLTVDIPLIRLADGEPWSILMLRTGTTFLTALVIWAIWRAITPKAPPLIPGREGLAVAALAGVPRAVIRAARRHLRVVGFEPDPEEYARLVELSRNASQALD